ncbi:MAG: nickel pincer cofactor biosynthesis protein LarC [Bryobacterales bacterium]|nr:nickel pincer cofactor biosynthesis protein LarC [Bryobacterales bacterium]
MARSDHGDSFESSKGVNRCLKSPRASLGASQQADAAAPVPVTICYLDCFSGIAGDMLLGALVDAGLDVAVLQAEIAKLGVDGLALRAEPVKRGGLAGTKVSVEAGHDHSHRSLATIERIIGESTLDERVKRDSTSVFRRLGEVEARSHAIPVEKVHFHEVGAYDSIADIVGSCAGLCALGIDRVWCSPINLGSGTVQAAHGTMPVPAPATARLLEGVPTYSDGPSVELTTPTGAALAVTLSEGFGPPPAMRISHSGYGAGSRDFPERANLVRVLIGKAQQADTPPEQVWILEANIDDMTPEMAGFAMERLLESGALDVTLTPVQMKKNRPGFTLTVLASPGDRERLGAMVLAETSTLGIREVSARRRALPRAWTEVSTSYGTVRVKTSGPPGAAGATFAPEYEDCRKLARQHGVPFKRVWEQAHRAYLQSRDA